MRDEQFGRLLRAAIGSVVAHEATTAPVVEAELGAQIGLSPASIQRYKAGHIPPEPRTVALLASAGVQRGFLNARWLERFLRAARYYDTATLLAQLYPQPSLAVPDNTGAPLHNLPAPTYARFIACTAYAEVLAGLAQRSPAVLISGLGGSGKTSLAREVAARCLDDERFAAVVWVSDQDRPGATGLDTLLTAIARTLDYPALLQLTQAERMLAVERLLRRRPVLLVIDQCETIGDSALLQWLTRLPEPSKALLTSRIERPELRQGTWLVRLGGLNTAEAAAFLDQQLQALGLDERVRDRSQLDRLCQATGGNPKALALLLGALRSGPRTLQQLLDELAGAPGALVDAVLARSWALLDPAARRLLLAAPLFAGTIDPAALVVVAGETQGADALARLVESSLLDVLHPDLEQPPRYVLHPLVRASAAAQVANLPELVTQMRQRQLAWYAELAAGVGYCWDDLGRLARLDPEQETIIELIGWGAAAPGPELARLVRGVDYYCYIRGLWTLMPELGALRAAAARMAGDVAEATRALAYQLQMRCRQGQLAEVEPRLAELAELQAQPDLPSDVRFELLYTIGLYWTLAERYEEASRWWELGLPLAGALSVRDYAVNRGWLAICYYRRGEPERAAELWRAVLADAAAGGFVRGVVSSQIGLARVALDRGELAESTALLAAALAAARPNQDRGLIAEIQTLQARCGLARGEHEAARALLAAARTTYIRLGLSRDQAEAEHWLRAAGAEL